MKNLFDNPILLLVLVLLIVVVFGAKRLPDAARSLGRSMRIFKTEVKEMKEDGKDGSAAGTPGTPMEGRVLDTAAEHRAAASEQSGQPVRDQQRSGA